MGAACSSCSGKRRAPGGAGSGTDGPVQMEETNGVKGALQPDNGGLALANHSNAANIASSTNGPSGRRLGDEVREAALGPVSEEEGGGARQRNSDHVGNSKALQKAEITPTAGLGWLAADGREAGARAQPEAAEEEPQEDLIPASPSTSTGSLSRKELATAEWLSAEGWAKVTQPRGKIWTTTGVVREGCTYCHVEEAAYLVERGSLALARGGRQLSAQDAYELLEACARPCPWDAYVVYAYLRRLGFVVGRHGVPWSLAAARQRARQQGGEPATAACATGDAASSSERATSGTGGDAAGGAGDGPGGPGEAPPGVAAGTEGLYRGGEGEAARPAAAALRPAKARGFQSRLRWVAALLTRPWVRSPSRKRLGRRAANQEATEAASSGPQRWGGHGGSGPSQDVQDRGRGAMPGARGGEPEGTHATVAGREQAGGLPGSTFSAASRLRPFPTTPFVQGEGGRLEEPFFDVYPPNSSFRKKDPGPAAFSLYISSGWPPPHPRIRALQHANGDVPLKFAVVVAGHVSIFGFTMLQLPDMPY